MEKVTTDIILQWVTEAVENKTANLDVQLWVDIALKLSILIGDENAKLFDLQQKKAKMQLDIKTSKEMSVSESKLRIEASDEYRDYHKQKAKIAQIEELIRVVKLQARVNQGI